MSQKWNKPKMEEANNGISRIWNQQKVEKYFF
jgi:hypothetical protein